MSRQATVNFMGVFLELFLAVAPRGGTDATVSSLTELGVSSQTLSLGAVEGLHAQAHAIFGNIAALPGDAGSHYSAFYTTLADGESSYLVSAMSAPVGDGHLGIGFAQKRSANLDETALGNNDEIVGVSQFAVSETELKVGYRQMINPSLAVGVGVNYYIQDLYLTQGTGWNVNVGAQWRWESFLFSVSKTNVLSGSQVEYTHGYDSVGFSSDLVMGSKYELSDQLSFYGQIKGIKALKSLGVTYSPFSYINGSLGWREIEANGTHTQLSAGLSLTLAMMMMHFSYQTSEVEGYSGLYGVSIDVQI